jgi:hypothetical protein
MLGKMQLRDVPDILTRSYRVFSQLKGAYQDYSDVLNWK